MIYLISGASRAGKTILTKKLSILKGIPYLSLDWLIMGFTNGIPAYGIHDKLFPDEIAERFWSFFKAMAESMLYVDENCIIEGEAMLPELIIELIEKYPTQLKICFVGYTDVAVNQKVDDIKGFSVGKTDWMSDKSDTYILDHVIYMTAYSKRIKKSCQEHGLQYFDTSKNFLETINAAVDYMRE